ncbi:endonuclease III [Thermoclostridium stercorarium subsp. stercorarium DSM 8532]|jgi:endonuclease-3|uniref:Endonuclease III n=3 Tax=Thermoclostridium stercorarium TaxID=1510 RepID=L7VLW4_THES1|nr:endonuclease III [Thermoclostridium stercorarium]AGC69170.1 endonuclease III [Thermoclostridium stercorarium subsp. stercorarium DSM 8532]AGI40140.1 DNA lyase [Thermoclostridium stercorarium subsp. stercorarium DSM 8532]ANW99449.1 endonuclease III [Thermoclostridium stercorarium subsp. thermolacticum DSM 2910]ANX02076.1 endonuclease III [Thermoclostridium stercorarium subsp. leptospartum DSM 9219]UZQ85136.1 endonuclease III [Thermoclostridium stercorarium]
MPSKETVNKIIEELERLYPDAGCSLTYSTPLQLLIATQLAAQCTDERVNIVTKELFKKYKTAEDFANADLKALEQDIRPTGFYRNKARNIKECCRMIIEKFNGEVPDSMEKLLMLPGVGRKTANVILGNIYNIPGIVVDTHAKRLSNRMGLTKEEDPVKIEFDLMKIIPREKWSKFSNQLVFHGRAVCKARKPDCEACSIRPYCVYGQKTLK